MLRSVFRDHTTWPFYTFNVARSKLYTPKLNYTSENRYLELLTDMKCTYVPAVT